MVVDPLHGGQLLGQRPLGIALEVGEYAGRVAEVTLESGVDR
jgi:hypothetical protein